MHIRPPRHIVWSTDTIDLDDPFQYRWTMRQVLLHGRAEDVRELELDDVARLLDDLDLPRPIHGLWAAYLERREHAQR